jgi:hypothetical protein
MSQPPATLTVATVDELEKLLKKSNLYYTPPVLIDELTKKSDITLITEEKILNTSVDFLKNCCVQLKNDSTNFDRIRNKLTSEGCKVIIDNHVYPTPSGRVISN